MVNKRVGSAELAPNNLHESLVVGFLTTIGVNVGDEFIREGIRHCFDSIGIPINPYFVNKHDPDSLSRPRDLECGVLSDKILDCDVFVQSGAPVYWHHGVGGHRSTAAEWHSWAWEERILPASPEPVFLNLGAGSCQPWGDGGRSFLEDPGCADFATRAATRAALTTVRDPVADDILKQLDIEHHCLPCPAFLAAGRLSPVPFARDLVGVNLMPLGGHFDFGGDFDKLSWILRIHELLQDLRKMGRVIFICHDTEEVRFAEHFATASERIFVSSSYRDYLDLFRNLTCIFANRVHAAVAASGFGVPAIIAGGDTRARIGEWIGLDVMQSKSLHPEDAAQRMEQLMKHRVLENERLIELREQTLRDYTRLIAPILAGIRHRANQSPTVDVEGPIQRWIRNSIRDSEWIDRIAIDQFWFIREKGFHDGEIYEGAQLRWTGGMASVQFPPEFDLYFDRLTISLWGVHPEKHFCRVRVNNEVIIEAALAADSPWSGEVSFTPRRIEKIEIESDVLQPEGDPRRLGVALRDLRIRRNSGTSLESDAPVGLSFLEI